MSDQPADDETEAYTAWLLSLSADQIARHDRSTICDWLAARNEQRCAQLRAAVRALREQCVRRERAHARLAAALHIPASPVEQQPAV